MLVSAMEISAGLRMAEGRERIRVRRAFPRSQAVLAVKEGKMAAGESSRAMSSSNCFVSRQIYISALKKCFGSIGSNI